MNILLEAQRRVAESKLQYFRSQVDYMLAIKSIQFEKGTMLDWMNVRLNEAQSKPKALRDANELANSRRGEMSYVVSDQVISRGPKASFSVQPNSTIVSPELTPPNGVLQPVGPGQTGQPDYQPGTRPNISLSQNRPGTPAAHLTGSNPSYLIENREARQPDQIVITPDGFSSTELKGISLNLGD